MKAMTGKILLRLGVLSLTFLVGCMVQLSVHRLRVSHASVNQPLTNNVTPPAGWKKISIGTVSFYVPPGMQPTVSTENAGVVEAVGDDYLYLYYAYGPTMPADVNIKPTQSEQIIIRGRASIVNRWERLEVAWTGLDHGGIQVVMDAGNGSKFEIYALTDNLPLAQKVIDTIEHH